MLRGLVLYIHTYGVLHLILRTYADEVQGTEYFGDLPRHVSVRSTYLQINSSEESEASKNSSDTTDTG